MGGDWLGLTRLRRVGRVWVSLRITPTLPLPLPVSLSLTLTLTQAADTQLLILGGEPIDEPIAAQVRVRVRVMVSC